ncbi:Arginine-fifty homeobox [Heterocephalus glaber]|uniref:Arginine-fifty homeobox n=1 Tax=Heterocephalus glaber TaxID=10181 RepID=G5BBK6_HETGA|nr:Arginine-fifty homeobox [Heterocephalus glaber]
MGAKIGNIAFVNGEGLSSQISKTLNRMTPENPQLDCFLNQNYVGKNLIAQVPSGPTIRKKHQGRTSFTHKQHKELEALFSQTSFPDKNLQKDLAARLNLQEKTIKVWFRNRRFKQRKQQKQQQQSLQQSSQILPAKKNMPSSLRMSTNPYSFFPMVLNLHISLPYQPMSPSDCSEDFVFTESPEIDFQVQDPQLEGLMASVPALFPNT